MQLSVWVRGAALWMHRLGGALCAAVGAVIVADVAGRLFFNKPYEGTVELVATFIVILTFLQVPYAILEKKLLRVTFLVDAVPPSVRGALNALAYAVGTVFFAAICIISWEPTVQAISVGEYFGTDAFRIPGWPLRVSSLLLWLLSALACLHLCIEALAGRMTEKDDQLPD